MMNVSSPDNLGQYSRAIVKLYTSSIVIKPTKH